MKQLIYFVIFFSSAVNAAQPAIQIKRLESEQSVTQLVALQKTMHMSANPKELSKEPQTICFKANINKFLPPETTVTKPIYGCVFSDQPAMNAALLRAGLFVHTTMGMADDQSLFGSNLMTAVAGHDFNGEELANYSKQAAIPKDTIHEHVKLKAIESEFDRQIIKPIIKQNQENFIFFAIINTKKYKANLSHELLHAQYYNLPQIQPILLQVWNEVPAADQTIIVSALRDGGYDMDQQELLLREFYSYFLQYDAKDYLATIKVLAPMADLAPIYAPKIKAALAVAGIKVLEVT
jgi:hypothetical protein